MHLKIGNKLIGDDQPCYVIAEIGSNHNQDYSLATELIDAAAKSGVDAVKFQTFRAKDHYSRFSPGFGYLKNTSTFDLIESLELNREWQASLKSHAEKAEVEFLTSPCDYEAIDQLKKLDLAAYKLASFDLPDNRLIACMAQTGKPLILSTGMASMADIELATKTARAHNNDEIILLQCTSLYPAPSALTNLNSMATMRASFSCLTGYSDHTLGEHIPLAAVALGACMLEKHFTLDRSLPGPDHNFAIEPKELESLVKHAREVEHALGDGRKNGPRDEEQEMFQKGRRSIHAKRAISQGELIQADMLTIKRPGYGLSPSLWDTLVGRRARVDIKEDEWITWEQL